MQDEKPLSIAEANARLVDLALKDKPTLVPRKRTPDEVKECFQLRLAWSRSKRRFAVLKRAKRGTNRYQCERCGKIFKYRDMTVDHVEPVVSVEEGWQGMAEFARRLYCEPEDLRAICIDKCHAKKTEREQKERAKNRRNINAKNNVV